MNIQKLKKVIQEANPEICVKFGDRTEIGTIYNGIKPSCRPIRLADVLLAIKQSGDEYGYGVFENGNIYWNKENNRTKTTWNLKDNNLDNQSDECKEFLIKLLVKNI